MMANREWQSAKGGAAGARQLLVVLVALLFAFACMALLAAQPAAAVQPETVRSDSLGEQDLTPAHPPDFGAVQSAYLAWLDPQTGALERCDADHAIGAKGEASFDVVLVYANGAERRASEVGEAVTWKLENYTWGGETFASVDVSGTVSLSRGASKLVFLNAECGSYAVEGSPVVVSLVDPGAVPEPPEGGVTVASADVSWSAGASTNTWGAYDVGAIELPRIRSAGGAVRLTADVAYARSPIAPATLAPTAEDADLLWRTGTCYDQIGAHTNTMLASASSGDGVGRIVANGAGDGWVVLRCDSLAYPEFAGREIAVRIAGNDATASAAAPFTIDSAQLVYRDSNGVYRDYRGYTLSTSPTAITEPFGSVAFDVLIFFADGSSARASACGQAVNWTLKGAAGIASLLPDGTLRATHAGNGRVRIAEAVVNGTHAEGVSAYVRIANNDAGVVPIGQGLSVTPRSNYWLAKDASPIDSDSWYWRSAANSGAVGFETPLVVGSSTSQTSMCTLAGIVTWTDGTTTVSADVDGGVRLWSVVGCTDPNGNPCDDLVAVDEAGRVTSTETGSGFATIRCDTSVSVYDAQGNRTSIPLWAILQVAVFQPVGGVDYMVMLDRDGKELKTTSLVLPNGDSLYRFSVRIYYRDGSTASTYPDADDYDAAAASNLVWNVYRTEDRGEKERYSSIRDGEFHAETGFARAYASALLEGASFAGKDVECGVTVIAEDTLEPAEHTDAIKVSIYHYSDYLNHGASAPVAKEITITRAQLEVIATYRTWYTFLRRNGTSFSTVYARGVAMENLLALCGVDGDRLVSMLFEGSDSYVPERHSADFILGSQFRYTDFYYHVSLPGIMRAQSVAPMLALEYYMKNNAGYEDATDKDNAGSDGFDYMVTDSTMRIIFGMTGPSTPNARLSVTRVNALTIIVDDNTFAPEQPDEDDPPVKPEDDKKKDDPDDREKPQEKDPERPVVPVPGEDDPEGDEDDPDADGESDEDDPDHEGGKSNDPATSGEKGDPGNGTSGGTNPYQGGKRNEGVGTDRKRGKQVAMTPLDSAMVEVGFEDGTNDEMDTTGAQYGTQATEGSDGQVERSGEMLLREMMENSQADKRMIVPAAEIDGMYWVATGSALGLMLVLGAGAAFRRYRRDDRDGELLGAQAS